MNPTIFPDRDAATRERAPGTSWHAPAKVASLALVLVVPLLLLHGKVDLPLSQWLHAHQNGAVQAFFGIVTRLGDWGLWVAACLAALCGIATMARAASTPDTSKQWRQRARSIVLVLCSWLSSGIVVNFIKFVVGRTRPSAYFGNGLYEYAPFSFSGHNSFPSGHTQAIFSIMSALWFVCPRYRFLYAIIAILVGISRIVLFKHWLTDVIAGAAVGVLGALYVKRWFEQRGYSFVWTR